MTNLIMCEGTGCKRKESCARFVQIPLPKYQAWLCMSVACADTDRCKWYIDVNSPRKG